MILEGHGKNEKAPVMEAFSFIDFPTLTAWTIIYPGAA